VTVTSLIARYDHVLLDLDGCVWVGDQATEGAVEAIGALRAAGKGIAFVTNDTQLSTEEYVRKLWRLGFQASLEEVVTCGGALQFLLAETHQGGSAVVIGSPALHRHVEAAGLRIVNKTAFASRADVVVVAFHPNFN
jgi:glycerol 3-phosphatase-2